MGSDPGLPPNSDPAVDDDLDDQITEDLPSPQAVRRAHDQDWKTLHPASLAVNLLPTAWRTARGAWPLLLALVIGGEGTGLPAVELFVLVLFFTMAFSRTFVHWATLRYRIHEGQLAIKSGLINRRARNIDPTRIQNIELVRNLFHKAAGLVELRVETAGDASTEGLLSALSVAEAESLRRRLKILGGRGQEPTAPQASDDPIVTMGVLEIIAYGFSRRTVGVVALLTGLSVEILGRFGPENPEQLAWAMRPGVLVAAIMLAFAGSWVLSAGRAFLRHFRYRMDRLGQRLITQEGLTTRRTVEIPLSKVQLVRVDEPFLRRMMGYGTVLIETAGLGIADGQLRQAEGVAPMVEREDLPRVAASALPDTDVDPWSTQLKPAHPRALYRATVGRAVRSALLAGAITAMIGVWGALAFVLVPLALPLAWLDWKRQGWLVTDHGVVATRGWFTRHTWLINREKLQSVHLEQGPIMRWHGLGRVVVRVAGSEVYLPDIAIDLAHEVMADLAPQAS